MLVYNYDDKTNEFLYASEAVIDERASKIEGKEVYLIPAKATTIAPPKSVEGYVYCFNEKTNNWYQVEDHRGQVVYSRENLSEHIIDEIGPIPANYLVELPQPDNKYQIWENGKYTYPTLDELKSTIKSDLDDAYELKISKPYRCGSYYVLPNWATTYTTTLVAMQQDVQEDGKLDETYLVLLITNPAKETLTQVKMNTIEEFMPYYEKVKDTFKEITTEYHNKIVQISLVNNADDLVKIILNY